MFYSTPLVAFDIPCVEKYMIAARLLSFIGKAVQDPNPLRPTKLMLTTCCNNNRKRGRPYTTNKDTIVNCLVLLFERVPEVAIDQNQGSMIDWIKEVNNEKYWKSLIRCLLKSDEEIPTRPTDEGWNQTPRPQPQPAPCPTPERRRQRRQRSTRRTRPNQSSNSNPPPPPGSPHNADSKHRRHPLHQGETESLHHNEQNTETEIG